MLPQPRKRQPRGLGLPRFKQRTNGKYDYVRGWTQAERDAAQLRGERLPSLFYLDTNIPFNTLKDALRHYLKESRAAKRKGETFATATGRRASAKVMLDTYRPRYQRATELATHMAKQHLAANPQPQGLHSQTIRRDNVATAKKALTAEEILKAQLAFAVPAQRYGHTVADILNPIDREARLKVAAGEMRALCTGDELDYAAISKAAKRYLAEYVGWGKDNAALHGTQDHKASPLTTSHKAHKMRFGE